MTENEENNHNIDCGCEVCEKTIEIKKTPFKKFNKYTEFSKKFDKEKIKIKRNGKYVNAYDYAQSNRTGTEIYATLEKYNGNLKMTQDAMKNYALELRGNIGEIGDLQTVLNNKIKAEQIWENMPEKIKKQFNYSMNDFLENGETWVKNMIEEKKKSLKSKKEKEE